MGIGTAVYAIAFGLSLIGGVNSGNALGWLGVWAALAVVVTIGVLIAGIACVSLARTRAFGAGLLISIAIGIIVGNGACIAVLNNT
jgi:hypothetical protein